MLKFTKPVYEEKENWLEFYGEVFIGGFNCGLDW